MSEAELIRWGRHVGETIAGPAFIGLSGALGAGKSVLARAIGAGAGVEEPMPSPTFTLLQRYPAGGGRHVVHFDLYRIDAPDELWELGWGQLGAEDEIVLVEWPEHAERLLPADRWTIELRAPSGRPDLREVEISRSGSPPELVGFPITVADV